MEQKARVGDKAAAKRGREPAGASPSASQRDANPRRSRRRGRTDKSAVAAATADEAASPAVRFQDFGDADTYSGWLGGLPAAAGSPPGVHYDFYNRSYGVPAG